jgi:hypothetical protein
VSIQLTYHRADDVLLLWRLFGVLHALRSSSWLFANVGSAIVSLISGACLYSLGSFHHSIKHKLSLGRCAPPRMTVLAWFYLRLLPCYLVVLTVVWVVIQVEAVLEQPMLGCVLVCSCRSKAMVGVLAQARSSGGQLPRSRLYILFARQARLPVGFLVR